MASRTFWRLPAPLVLASASAVRRDLLVAAGLSPDIMPAIIDERAVEQGLEGSDPADIARALAAAKAISVSLRQPGRLVLGCDQTLALGEDRLHKPRNRDDARSHLARLSGRTHHLFSALALAMDGAIVWHHLDSAAMTMRLLSTEFVETYLDLAGNSVCSSVGAYRLEETGMQLFDRIEGRHSTILGLPMLPLLAELRAREALLS